MTDTAFSYADPKAPAMQRGLIRLVEAATGKHLLRRMYLDMRRDPIKDESFFQGAVRRLELNVQFDRRALDAAPREGPLVVVANHPYGVLDGIVLSWLVEQVRRDFLVLTNAVLLRAPELQGVLLPVDFTGTPEALQTNLASRAAARAHLARGGCVIVFPAGAVSTAPDRLGRKPAVDAPWQSFTSHLIHRSGATVLPIHFDGQNSRLFQVASHVSQTLRVALIFREVRNRIGTSMAVTVGAPIPYAELQPVRDRQALAEQLRERTYALVQRSPLHPRRARPRTPLWRPLAGRLAAGDQPRPR